MKKSVVKNYIYIIFITIIGLLIIAFLMNQKNVKYHEDRFKCYSTSIINYEVDKLKVKKVTKTTDPVSYRNAPSKLSIESVYGDIQAYHPKVLYFENGFNGYKYWMSYTPYPYASSKYENPHVKASNDLVTWEAVPGSPVLLDEPDDWMDGLIYNSDSHLVYNTDTGLLECWWRRVDHTDKTMTIYRRTTADGVTWTEKEIVYRSLRSEVDWISPAVIYENHIYKIWYVFNNRLYYVESSDLKNYTSPREIKVSYEKDVKTWHIDVIHNNDTYELIAVAYTNWNRRKYQNLYYMSSKDNINYSEGKIILTPTTYTNNWDSRGLYRSSILYINDTYYIFYSGHKGKSNSGIGLVYGKDIYNLNPYYGYTCKNN